MSVDVVTFGCRLNAYESEVIRREATAAGLADAVVVNTCAVTAEAVRQARQAIRKRKREQPDARIVVTGCAAQTEPQTFAAMPEVALVLGNEQKLSAEAWRAQRDALARAPFGLDRDEKVAVNDIMAVTETAAHLVDGLDGRARAFVQVQNGCDHRCTFCIIPYGRGNSRSVPMGEVVAQVRRLTERGYREIVLTGVDLTSYGATLPGAPRLGSLVKQILLPLIAAVTPGKEGYVGWKETINGSEIHYGQFIGEVVNFLLVAAAVFLFIVKFLGWVMRTRQKEPAPPTPPLSRQEELLTEIRDLLKTSRAMAPPA